MKNICCFFLLILLFVQAVYAEVVTSVEITALSGLTRDENQEFVIYEVGKTALNFDSVGNPDVRAQLELDTIVTEAIMPDVKRAFVKVRFPGFRITAGKTRESWGEGFLFNAGDVIFGSMDPIADLSEAILRDETAWLVDLYVPLGQFSHIEAIVLPYAPGSQSAEILNSVHDMRAGGRIVTKLWGIKIEGGYLFKADQALHHPYVSFQGNLFFDLQLSAALQLPAEDATPEDIEDGFTVSFGLMHIFSTDEAGTWTVRMEGALRPFGSWEEVEAADEDTKYGLLLYPEIDYAPDDFLSFQLRSIISPIDASAVISFGCTYNIYQGLNILATVAVQLGDEDDVFGWDREGDVALLLGLEYIF
ncbi:MAG: hypothetical protein JW822_07125 [Spirochaetales bacterium]|nr:hypothetical protein [Spirochaetales bacterium]